jgi:hypothetical protein
MKSYEKDLRVCSESSRQDGPMADFLAILGFVAFTLASLGLIKVLDKV